MMFSVASFIQAEIETVGTTVIPAESQALRFPCSHTDLHKGILQPSLLSFVFKLVSAILASEAQLAGELSCRPKCCGFHFWSGHIPRL